MLTCWIPPFTSFYLNLLLLRCSFEILNFCICCCSSFAIVFGFCIIQMNVLVILEVKVHCINLNKFQTYLFMCSLRIETNLHFLFFFDRVNVSVGVKETRMMMTGMHTVADIFCVGCGSIVGWTYVWYHKSEKLRRFMICSY